ncbi:hypothetical protein OAG68_00360 [bacterium]|nr:hypothetical protein [bacterium]
MATIGWAISGLLTIAEATTGIVDLVEILTAAWEKVNNSNPVFGDYSFANLVYRFLDLLPPQETIQVNLRSLNDRQFNDQ